MVQSGHAGRIEAPEGGLAFVGKRVEKGDVLALLHHHIEAYNKGNLQGEIAELEERIKLQEAKLARYLKAPLAIPPIRIETSDSVSIFTPLALTDTSMPLAFQKRLPAWTR